MPSRSPLDLLLAFVGVSLVAFGPVSVVTSILFPPDVGTTLLTVGGVAVLSIPLAVWYWKSGRSVGDLGVFFFWVTGLIFVFGFAAMSLLRVVSGETGGAVGGPLAVVLLAVAYAGAYYLVYRGGWEQIRTQIGSQPAVDLLLAAVGVFLVTFGPVSIVSSYLFPPDAVTTLVDFGATALLALPLAVWYWRSGRSVGDLGMFFFWVMALTLVFGLLAFSVFVTAGPVETGSVADFLVTGTFLAVVYGVAYHMVYRDGWEQLRTSVG
jgi:hypothetical protein